MPSDEQRLTAALSEQPLDFQLSDISKIRDEVDSDVGTLISALTTAQKLTRFLPGSLDAELVSAIKVLTGLKAVLDKMPG